MKKITLIKDLVLIVAVLVLLVYIFFCGREIKIAYVDSAKLLENYKGMSIAREAYRNKSAIWEANIDSLLQEVKSEIQTYEKASLSMTEKQKVAARQQISAKQERLNNYQKTLRETAQKEDVRMTQEVLQQVNLYISRYGKAHGYDFILTASQASNIAYVRESRDITDDIVTGLNQEYTGSAK